MNFIEEVWNNNDVHLSVGWYENWLQTMRFKFHWFVVDVEEHSTAVVQLTEFNTK